MKLIKETERRVVAMTGYIGVCDGCGTPIEYEEPLVIIILEELEDRDVVVPADRLACPNCLKTFATMTIHKNLDVTEEIRGLQDGK